jgi:hypothetical protein
MCCKAFFSSLFLLAAGAVPALPAAPPAADSPAVLLDRAIAASGGEAALRRSPALLWQATALVRSEGHKIAVEGRWALQPPDRAVIATWEALRGEAATRRLIVAGSKGWLERDGKRTPLSAAELAFERDQLYIYSLLRLLPLRDRGVKLTAIPPDNQGRPGLRVVRSGRPEVDLYFGADDRPERLRLRITDPATGRPVEEEIWLAGVLAAEGIRWPQQVRITWNGTLYSAMSLVALTPRAKLDDPALGGAP